MPKVFSSQAKVLYIANVRRTSANVKSTKLNTVGLLGQHVVVEDKEEREAMREEKHQM